MTLRDQRQSEFAQRWLKSGRRSILHLCPRFGKIRTSIKILQEYTNPKVLVAYPDNKIRDSWKEDFKIMGYDDSNVTYTTHRSIKKYENEQYDLVIIDEIHLLSKAQIVACQHLTFINREVLGLSGTLSSGTEKYLRRTLGMNVAAVYSIKQAIAEKVITDYEIKIITVKLDDKVMKDYSGKVKTEKKYYEGLSYVIKKLEEEEKDTMFLRLKRKSVIQNSYSKIQKTKTLLNNLKDKRVLVFCGTTAISDSLGTASYHSKTKDKVLFEEFSRGEGNHLAVVKIGNTGVTYKPLNCVILNDFDSNSQNLTQKINRCMAYEYDNPEKKATIYIITTDEEVELKWLDSALRFFDKNKIKYL